MKGRVLAIARQEAGGHIAALLQDGKLDDLLIDPPLSGHPPAVGAICVVRITRKLPKAGAFCEMSGGAEGFLRDARAVSAGDLKLVQVSSLPEPGKAVTLTTRLLFKGPRLILTPEAPGVNVSRRIGNTAERDRLTACVSNALAEKDIPEGCGVIVRSAARNAEEDLLISELGMHVAAWTRARERLNAGTLHTGTEGDALTMALTAWCDPLPVQVLCTPNLWAEAENDLYTLHPGLEARTVVEQDPIEASGADEELRMARGVTVPIAGGRMSLEGTRALVAVDIDTGGDFTPAAGLKVNLEVARALPRQLRVRGLGGLIVVDFAPMPKQHRRTLEEALRKAFRADPIETALVGWSPSGLFELQRKRERRRLFLKRS